MPDWETIFEEKGYVFVDPHSDIPRLAKIFNQDNVRRILDLGCGTGRHLVYLSKQGFEMYGFDASKTAIDLMSKWLEEEELEANFCISQMEEPFPYQDDFFDAVISIQVIHHNLMDDILATISEITRVLKIGGYLFITVPILTPKPVNPSADWKLQQIEEHTFIPNSGPESGIPHHYFTEEELKQVFNNYEILEMFIDDTNHRCLFGIRRY